MLDGPSDFVPTLQDLMDYDPSLVHSLNGVRDMSQEQFQVSQRPDYITSDHAAAACDSELIAFYSLDARWTGVTGS